VRRIGDPAIAIGVGQLGQLDQQVQVLDGVEVLVNK